MRNGGRAVSTGIALAFMAVVAISQTGCAGSGLTGVDDRAAKATHQSTSVDLMPPRVRLPAAPAPYRLPPQALRVSSSAQLRSALANHRTDTIVLAPGTYDNDRPFTDRDGDRLYAERLGRAVFTAGVVIGANEGPSGALLRGIRFDVKNPAKTFDGAIVHVWGAATHAAVLDTWLDGNNAVDAGLVVRQPEGFVGQRIVATSFRGYGVLVDPNQDGYRARVPFVLSDIAVAHVMRPVPGSSDGTAEACLWLGSRGVAKRVSVRSCGVSGIWTGTAMTWSRVEDASVDRAPVGIYIEHFTTHTIFRRLRIGPNVDRGVNAEWANYSVGGKPASVDNEIANCYFHTAVVGVYLDQGTTGTVVHRCTFVGQRWAAIGDYKGVDNRYFLNDFSGIDPGAVAVSYKHGGRR